MIYSNITSITVTGVSRALQGEDGSPTLAEQYDVKSLGSMACDFW